MTKVVIRRPQVSEQNSVRALVQIVVDEIYGDVWAPPPLHIDEEDWSQAWIAVSDGEPLGMVLTDQEWISDLWVLRRARGQGLGGKLLAQGEAEIASRGHVTFRLRVVKSNVLAVRFYQRHQWCSERTDVTAKAWLL